MSGAEPRNKRIWAEPRTQREGAEPNIECQ
jgi:hypothetical protein